MTNTKCILDIPEKEYHAATKNGEYLSSHMLADFRACPRQYYLKLKGEITTDAESNSFILGRAAHKLILEGGIAFAEEFEVGDGPINPKTGEGRYRTFLNDAKKINPNLRIIGLTATPCRTSSDLICKPENLLNEVCYEGSVRLFIGDGYLSKIHSKSSKESVNTDNLHIRAGEVTSSYPMREREIAKHVRDAVCEIGYTDAYRNKWGKANAISGNDLEVAIHIGQQSPDIAKGVNLDGWGDQGIFFGMATNDPSTEFMPKDYWLAKQIGRKLFQGGIGGLDIKTQVTTENGEVARVVVAIPLQEDQSKKAVEEIVRSYVGKEADITINGTGRYVTHSSIGDAEPRTLHWRIV